MRSAIVKAKNGSEQRQKSRRKTKFAQNSPSASHYKRGYNSNQPQSVFSRINRETANPLPVNSVPKPKTRTISSPRVSEPVKVNDKVVVSVGTQTDPCKCSLRNKQKNKNRRVTAKRNRDLVQQLVNSEVIQFTN